MNDYKASNKPNNSPQEKITNDFHIEEDEHFSYSDYKIEDWLAFILFWGLALTVFSQFLSRYVFETPLGWTEELSRYQLICLGFLGSCIGVRHNSHIFVNLFHRWFSQKLSHNIYRVIALLNLLFLTSLAFFAWQIIPLISIHKMAALPVSISVLYSAIFGSLLILTFRSAQHLIHIIKTPSEMYHANDTSTSCN